MLNWPLVFALKVLVSQSCLILLEPLDFSPPGSSVHGILQARILECLAIPFSSGPHFVRTLLQRKSESESEVTQSCPTLCDPMDCSLPGYSIHGIFQNTRSSNLNSVLYDSKPWHLPFIQQKLVEVLLYTWLFATC